jgi:HTH-type transcriptional regulator, sugar sensing transcriptional regulator
MGADRIVELLKTIGMSGYEAKAYVALVQAGVPLNGYEVAKSSGVPRSTVYETLGKLVARGAAFEVKVPSNGTAYLPLPAETLVRQLERELADTIGELEASLPALTVPSTAHLVQHVSGRVAVLDRAIDVIDGARSSIFASLWPDDLPLLLPALTAARQRGVDISCVAFGDADGELAQIGHVHEHRYSAPDVVLERLGCQIFTVVADRDAVLIGGTDEVGTWGMWSDDPAVVLVAAEYVRHDIALQIIVGRGGESSLDELWTRDPELERLRSAAAVTTSMLRSAPGAGPS